MPVKKILHIMWNERSHTPTRVIRKSHARYKRHGWKGMISRLNKEHVMLNLYETNHSGKVTDYKKWIEKNEKNISKVEILNFNPLISIITPTYNTPKKYLLEMLESVLAQTYTNWELCIADDASTNQDLIKILKEYEQNHENIKIVYRKKNGHISEASNSALSLTSGEFIAFLDHDDKLAPNALYEMVKKINTNKKLKLIYSDEDKINDKSIRFAPHFKSGWNRDMFYSHNYICHLVLLKKSVIDKVKGLRIGYEGSQDYDLLLRSLEYIKDQEIARVEKILYHWRAIKGSTAYGSSEKDYAHEAGLNALKNYFEKKDKDIKVQTGLLTNTYKIDYPLPQDLPLVSLIVPTRDNYDILHKCINSIVEKTLYSNYEIIIVDNETTCAQTLRYFDEIKQNPKIRILEYHHPFNYSSINNFAVEHTKGEFIGLINNDVELISEGWLSEMVSHALRETIGAVGAMLYYDNDTIQHAGVVLGIGGVAGHSHKNFKRGSDGYFSRLKIIQNFSAVTAACLVVKKSIYEEVGGLDEANLSVAFNDVDFCLKLIEKGYSNVWTPYVELYHHESVSRGADDNLEKVQRMNKEINYMKEKWSGLIDNDPKYNTNLTRTYSNFGLNLEENR